ncbi:MAG: hypothetical protein VCD00_20300, partial [Candidatus Hydrogenedentota bacterium]
GRTRGGVFGNWVFHRIIQVFGMIPAYSLLVFVAGYFLIFAPKALRASLQYQKRIGYNGPGFFSRMWGAYRHFFSYGITLLDRSAILMGFADKFTIELNGEEQVFRALEQGKGLVLTGAHCGNWEIAAHSLAAMDVPVHILMFEGEREKVQRFFDSVLRERNVRIIGVDGSDSGILECMQALSKGEVVAVLGDRTLNPGPKNTVLVPFLGKPARFPVGPHLLAALTGAPIIHVFAMRTSLYSYRYFVFPTEHLKLTKRSKRFEELGEWTALLVSRIESLLHEYPLQWYNFFEVWDEE